KIDWFCRLRVALRGHHILAQRGAPDAVLAHQAGHTLAADPDAMIISQLGVDAWRAVGVARAAVDGGDLARQLQIPSPPRAHRSIYPRVEPAPRYIQQSAHHPDRVGGLVHLHEPEERFEGPLSV